MPITINVTETPGGEAADTSEIRERLDVVEADLKKAREDVEALTEALSAMLKQMLTDKAASGAYGDLEPCDCGDPECMKQKAYEAQQAAKAEGPDRVKGGSGGTYL